ncbi:hypothetical protein B0H14DRAFT_3503813 [Mycena olivaceomarginata]|nr:hypothetical protein B0H14DRAFT_3503813 [Mycena olivaceomarginata]
MQYFKTDGTVFVSDFQGSETLLTDPQIMTSPYDSYFNPAESLSNPYSQEDCKGH